MKKMWGTRVLAMLLVLALTAGLVPAALAANSEVSVAFKQVPNDTLDTLIRPDLAVGEIENAEMGEDTAAYQAHDLVRVSIILEDASTLEAYSDAAAEGTLAEDAAAVSYRAALQRKQDSVVRKISSTILGREDLDVVWNLTLVANMISANVEYGKIEQIKLDWTSSAPAVVTVNNNGQIKAVSAGTATITAASHKNPEVHASCTVQVLAPNYTFRGLLTADNQVQTFEWNLADSETWEKVAAVDGIGSRVTSAGASSANGIYAFDVGGSAYEIDFATGKILNTGSAPFSDEIGPVAYDDIALSRKYTGTESLHGDLLTGVYSMNIIPMQDPMNGSASSYISVYDLFGYDADGFSGITSLGSITFKDPDSGEDVDAEAYYVIDNAGGIWQLKMK